MKTQKRVVALGMALAVVIAFHSFAYACDHAVKTETTKIETYVPSLTVDVAMPLEAVRVGHVSFVCTQAIACDAAKPTTAQTVKRTARVALTLGRALVTTVGAVVDSLVGAAVEATAGLV
ncbi:MAG: hypothetical protein OEX18_02090 [Candidatus Krumholzibacteria bacterium]|nr:hypothetical protein [Candidatus Krumholzibacteria bacterium]MDH4336051.1 hypothetical protein [Candidatus Krumholzibacteria bacterium]MDH5268373.1 hypothetical protein [Candidatus Krumholzibacteria bacterium]MDH5627317.1 hypothetical protein [Candidatus Krumholzibacteria bacterium]